MPRKRGRAYSDDEEDPKLQAVLEASRADTSRMLRNEAKLKEIAVLAAQSAVLFVTGAGLSCASGIAAFRTGDDAVWSKHVTDMGTKRAFRKDPVTWYNEFWLPTFEATVVEAKPSAAHKAIAKIARLAPRTRVVTQNVDGLHVGRVHGDSGVADPQLIEAHGRTGLFRCAGGCAEARNDWYELHELAEDDQKALSNFKVDRPPQCPKCHGPAMPLALLFDECYDAHFFFEADAWDAWLDECDAIVFVGTSFAAELTREALRRSKERGIPVFDVNVVEPPSTVVRAEVLRNNAILGKSEDLLPKLATFVEHQVMLTN